MIASSILIGIALGAIPKVDLSNEVEDMYRGCKDAMRTYESLEGGRTKDVDLASLSKGGYCAGFIEGVEEMLLREAAEHRRPLSFCSDGREPIGRKVRAFMTYVETHPRESRKGRTAMVIGMFESIYPCDDQ